MIIGTAHFVNFTKACDYFRQGEVLANPAALESVVRDKLAEGGIQLGKPELQPGERLLLIDNGTRYAVEV